MNRANYNPDTVEVCWETPYQQAHEWAHVEQHFRRTLVWQLRSQWMGIPFFERVANLAVELEAFQMARRDMKACGIWSDEDSRESIVGILSYALSLLSPQFLKFILPTAGKSKTAHPETATKPT